MNRILTVAAVIFSLGSLAPSALASKAASSAPVPGQMRVNDQADAFTADGIAKAEQAFQNTSFKSTTHFTVVTVGEKHVPAMWKADYNAAKKDSKLAGAFFRGWAVDLAKLEHERGIFALVFVEGDKYFIDVLSDKQTDVYRHFGDEDCKRVRDALIDAFKMAKEKGGDKATRDIGLIAASNIVVEQLKNTSAPENTSRTHATSSGNSGNGWFGSIGGMICIGLMVLMVVWIIIGIIRSFSGGGGYGGGGYGGGYGGGGGFFPSLMGGLFGAAAGMWLYDSFMGGHHASASDNTGDGATGDTGADTDTGAGDFDGGANAGGGDFGDTGGGDMGGGDYGGGDFGGGGGDFGGGDW